MNQRGTRMAAGRVAAAFAATLLVVFAVLASPRAASAHAFLDESEPADNAIVATLPPAVRLTFTEPLERSYSNATLYDQTGTALEGTALTPEPDDFSMMLQLPFGPAKRHVLRSLADLIDRGRAYGSGLHDLHLR